MDSPKVRTENKPEMTVPRGLNIDTITGPLFFIAHALKLMHIPLILPAFTFQFNKLFTSIKILIINLLI